MGFIELGDPPATAVSPHRLGRRAQVRQGLRPRRPRGTPGPDVAALSGVEDGEATRFLGDDKALHPRKLNFSKGLQNMMSGY